MYVVLTYKELTFVNIHLKIGENIENVFIFYLLFHVESIQLGKI